MTKYLKRSEREIFHQRHKPMWLIEGQKVDLDVPLENSADPYAEPSVDLWR
jgi:hypothetical protein